MSRLKSKKEIITEKVLNCISDESINRERALFLWWFTGRQPGLRLTETGLKAFTLADFEFWDIEFEQDGQSYHSFIVELNRKIDCPYYLGVNKESKHKPIFYIRLWDSKIAMLIQIYGSLQNYLQSRKDT